MYRVSNPYKPLMDSIFKLKLKVTIYRTEDRLFYDNEGAVPPYECCALHIPPGFRKNKAHVIYLSGPESKTLEMYIGNVAHEYVHAWQYEKGIYRKNMHDKKSQFIGWGKYLKHNYGINIF